MILIKVKERLLEKRKKCLKWRMITRNIKKLYLVWTTEKQIKIFKGAYITLNTPSLYPSPPSLTLKASGIPASNSLILPSTLANTPESNVAYVVTGKCPFPTPIPPVLLPPPWLPGIAGEGGGAASAKPLGSPTPLKPVLPLLAGVLDDSTLMRNVFLGGGWESEMVSGIEDYWMDG